MISDVTIRNLAHESTLAYFNRRVPGVMAPGHGPEGLAKYKEYMKEHEADWYKSDEFRDMFIKCPPGAIMWVARAFFGDGNTVKAGVNLSDRTIECLEWAENELGKEQYTMPYATEIAITIKYLKARKEKLAEETKTK
jgi:hypothetical protein